MSVQTSGAVFAGQNKTTARPSKRRTLTQAQEKGKWWRFIAILFIAAIVLVPIVAVVLLSLEPSLGSTARGVTVENFSKIFTETSVGTWLANSLLVTLVTVFIAVIVAARARLHASFDHAL